MRATFTKPYHDALQAGLYDAEQGPLGRVSIPAGFHQLPAFLIKAGQPLGPRAFFNVIPQLVLAGAFLKGLWEFDRASAEIPEQDSKGIDIHRIIILSCKELRGHVDGGSYDAAGHHGLWLTEAQVCDLGPVLLVQ